MKSCLACKSSIPDDAKFCGLCGFRVAPIAPESHRRLSQALTPQTDEEPIQLLTKATQKPAKKLVAQDAVSEGGAQASARAEREASRQPQASARAEREASRQPQAPAGGNGSSAAAPRAEQASRQNGADTRGAARFPLKVEVSYSSEHNFYTGFLENISGGGLFVATHQPVDIGQRLELTFTVPGLERTCTAACAVRWVREYNPLAPDTIPGMGLQFRGLDPEACAAIDLFIKHRDPIFFDDE